MRKSVECPKARSWEVAIARKKNHAAAALDESGDGGDVNEHFAFCLRAQVAVDGLIDVVAGKHDHGAAGIEVATTKRAAPTLPVASTLSALFV